MSAYKKAFLFSDILLVAAGIWIALSMLAYLSDGLLGLGLFPYLSELRPQVALVAGLLIGAIALPWRMGLAARFLAFGAAVMAFFAQQYLDTAQPVIGSGAGLNVMLMLFLIALGVSFYGLLPAVFAQALIGAGGFVGFASALAGFSNVGFLLGAMGPMAASLGIVLSLAALMRRPHRGVMQVVLSSERVARRMRTMLMIAFFGPSVIAWAFLRDMRDPFTQQAAMEMVLLIIFLLTGMVSVMGYLAERDDRKRRRLERRLEALAYRDGLTGVANRVRMERRFARMAERAGRDGGQFALVLVDLDKFKAINDAHGHAVGDRVLQQAAFVMDGVLRVEDLLARVGGEEFVVLLDGVGEGPAMAVAERLRAAIARIDLSHEVELAPVTASLGVAVWQPEEGLRSIFERADQALYASKAKGRDCVTFAAQALPARVAQDAVVQAAQ